MTYGPGTDRPNLITCACSYCQGRPVWVHDNTAAQLATARGRYPNHGICSLALSQLGRIAAATKPHFPIAG